MAAEPTLEAVKVDRKRREISIATLGRPTSTHLAEDLSHQLQALEQQGGVDSCALLGGEPDCTRCSDAGLTSVQRTGLRISSDADSTTIARVTCPTAPRFYRWVVAAWPRLATREVEFSEEEDYEREWKLQLGAALVCGIAALTAWSLEGRGMSLPLYLVAYVAGAWFTLHEIAERLRDRVIDIHFLMLAVAAGSASIGAWTEGSVLLFLFSLSGALEHFAMGRTQHEIRSLFKSAPKTATVIDAPNRERAVPVESVLPGWRLLVRPGEQFAVDAEVATGETSADESTLTGESVPVEKRPGDLVLAGTMNLWGVVEVRVIRSADQSALQKIIRLIRDAQRFKAPAQRLTDRFGSGYTWSVLGLCLVMFLVWWLGLGAPAFIAPPGERSAFYRTMTLLVVASPCALVLSIPSAVLSAIAWGARRGILFRGGAAVEKLAEVRAVAMDKTGTLTTGDLQVASVASTPAGREDEVLRIAFSLERLSHHPIAHALNRHGRQLGIEPLPVEQFSSITGAGIRGRVDGSDAWLGRREWLETNGIPLPAPDGQDTVSGHSEIWVAHRELVGRIALQDDVRAEARQVVARLRERGLPTIVLTGDRQSSGEQIQQRLAVDSVLAGLTPGQKVDAIRELTRTRGPIAMVGDGVNDAPSLAAAHVGVAMGSRGADAALEQAEVVLMHDRLENFLAAFELSRRARRVIWQNLVISLGTVLTLVGFALAGAIPLTVGVVGHEGSTVVVVMNSLRLLFIGIHKDLFCSPAPRKK